MEFKELSTKSVTELHKELAALREQVAELTVKLRLQQAKNTHQLTAHRRDIARIMTALSQKASATK